MVPLLLDGERERRAALLVVRVAEARGEALELLLLRVRLALALLLGRLGDCGGEYRG